MTLKIYFDPVSQGFYQTDYHKNIPKTAIEVTDNLRWALLEGESRGEKICVEDGVITLKAPTVEALTTVPDERYWRDLQLAHSDIELNKVQDSDPKAVGTVSQWREYRKALRAWPEHKDFPNKEKRPVSPDA